MVSCLVYCFRVYLCGKCAQGYLTLLVNQLVCPDHRCCRRREKSPLLAVDKRNHASKYSLTSICVMLLIHPRKSTLWSHVHEHVSHSVPVIVKTSSLAGNQVSYNPSSFIDTLVFFTFLSWRCIIRLFFLSPLMAAHVYLSAGYDVHSRVKKPDAQDKEQSLSGNKPDKKNAKLLWREWLCFLMKETDCLFCAFR